jgi:hypothetical protein
MSHLATFKGKVAWDGFWPLGVPNEDSKFFLFSSQNSAEIGRNLFYLSNSESVLYAKYIFSEWEIKSLGPELSVTFVGNIDKNSPFS